MKQEKFKQTEIGLIPEDWEAKKVGDFVDIKHGYAFKGEFFTDKPNENIVLTPGNFNIGGGFKSEKFKYTTEDLPDEYVLKEGDIIVTMTDLSKDGDTLGYSAKIPFETRKKFLHNQRLGLLKFKSKVDQNFLYWVLRTKGYNIFVVSSATGSTVKHTSPDRIKQYSFGIPKNVSEQEQIAKILSDLDSKIELNNQMNKTLEEIGQTIFQHWFVDFEFPNEEGKPYRSSGGEMVYNEELGKEIPKKWKVEELGEIVEFAYGKGLPETKRQEGNYPVIGSNGIIGFHSDYLVSGPGVVIGRKGTLGEVYWVEEDFFPIDTTFYLIDKLKSGGLYFHYFMLKGKDFLKSSSDSAVPGLNRNAAYSNNIIVPVMKMILDFNSICHSIFKKKHNLQTQSQILSNIRDSLLPKLMSGKIRVPVGVA